ncbi:MAG TPA: hypothetical protein VFE67_16435 [Rudaea sp.]|jgi:hypothetical protein|nr:hypothetical protein [Rudaea sp.]
MFPIAIVLPDAVKVQTFLFLTRIAADEHGFARIKADQAEMKAAATNTDDPLKLLYPRSSVLIRVHPR